MNALTITAYCLILGTMNYDAQANEQEGRLGPLAQEVSSRTQEHGEGASSPKVETQIEKERRKKRVIQTRDWRAANRERVRAYNAAYNAAKNPEETKAKRRAAYIANQAKEKATALAYHAANRDALLAAMRAYGKVRYAANKERMNASRKAAYAADPERSKARNKAWAKANPERSNAIYRNRRARKRNATIGNGAAIVAWEKSWKSKKTAVCFWCQRPKPSKACHVDHIQPISKGGAHSIENLCISCAPCNHSKHAKSFEEWNKQINQPVLI